MILCILCIITLFILIIPIIYSKKNYSPSHPSPSHHYPSHPQSIKMNEILDKYNDLSNYDENIPNGSLLISLLSTKFLTGNDKYNDYTIDEKCDKNLPSDFEKIKLQNL